MRLLEKNKQKMYYANKIGNAEIYQRDEDGNIVYIEIDGEEVPVKVGSKENAYSQPVEFLASISSSLNPVHAQAYGVDQSSIYSEVVVEKDYLPSDFGIGSLVWKKSPIIYDDEGYPKSNSADYIVMGIMDEGLYVDWYLLQRNNVDD